MATTAELELKVQSKDVDKAAKANQSLAASGEMVAKSSEKAAKSEDKQAKSSKRVAASGNDAAAANRRQSETARRLSKEYEGLQRQVAAVGAAFLTFQAARQALTIIADFGEAQAIVRALARATDSAGASFAEFNKQARALGATTRFTATQVSQAQASLLRGGLDTREALTAVASTLDLAIAGLLSLDRAAEITALTLNQFNLAASQSTRVADVLVQAANTSATNVEQLAQALKFAGPIAAGFGATLEQTTAALQVLANAGLQATIGGTNLRGAYAALSRPTARAAKQIELLARASGQSVEAFDITKRSLAEVFQAFKDANAGPRELLEIFGRLQAPGALALTRAGSEIEKFTKGLEGAEGAAATFREELQKELRDNLLALQSALVEIVLSLNDALGPALISTVKFLTQVAQALTANNEEIAKFSVAARAAAAALKVLGVVVAAFLALKLATTIGLAAKAVFGLVAAVKALGFAFATTGVGAIIVGLGIAAGFALEAAGAFDTIAESVTEADKAAKAKAASDKAEEQSARQRANAQRVADEKALTAAQMQLDAEEKLEEKRKAAGRAAARRAQQRRRDAETARVRLEVEDINIAERIDTAGLDRDVAEIRKAQDAFERLFAASKQIELRPGEGFFEAVERQVRDTNKQLALTTEFFDELTRRSEALREAQRREQVAVAQEAAFDANIRIAESLDDARFALENFNRTGLDRSMVDTAREFRRELEAIRMGTPSEEGGALADIERLAQSRFLLGLNEQLRETLNLMTELEMTSPRTADSFEQFAATAGRAIDDFRTKMQLPGADIAALSAAIKLTQERVKQFSGEVARAEGFKLIEEAVTTISRSFLNLFQVLVTGSEDAGQAFSRFLQSVTNALFQRFVVEQIIGAISRGFSLFGSANGNAFQSGSVVPFANGGIIGGPTVFPLGLAGEAGPEAIMPLSRGPNGKLGVQVNGGGERAGTNPFVLRSMSPGASQAPTASEMQRGGSRTTNVQFNVTTPDPNAFRRSSRQMTDLALQSLPV